MHHHCTIILDIGDLRFYERLNFFLGSMHSFATCTSQLVRKDCVCDTVADELFLCPGCMGMVTACIFFSALMANNHNLPLEFCAFSCNLVPSMSGEDCQLGQLFNGSKADRGIHFRTDSAMLDLTWG